jgi:serine/threonine protein kinase
MTPGEIITGKCGTPAYIAPEILSDCGYEGFAADIWSIGIILYSFITGNVPFIANTMLELQRKIFKNRYYMPDTLSPELKDLFKRILVLNPRDRITLTEILQHPWMGAESKVSAVDINGLMIDQNALEKVVKFGYPREFLVNSIRLREVNHCTATYFLLLSKSST